jgi:hypothetical protein
MKMTMEVDGLVAGELRRRDGCLGFPAQNEEEENEGNRPKMVEWPEHTKREMGGGEGGCCGRKQLGDEGGRSIGNPE